MKRAILAVLVLAAFVAGVVYKMRSGSARASAAVTLLSSPGPTFTVPAASLPPHWSLIAYGDTRFTDPANTRVANPLARHALAVRMAEEHPDALLISGDLPYDGANPEDYRIFQQETAPWRAAHLRVYPALGNHELHQDEIREPKNWWATFPELQGRRWYSVAFGRQYLIALDSDLPLTEASQQQLWLADQLDKLSSGTQFVFILLHHPPVADAIEGDSSHDVRPNEKALADFLAARAPGLHARLIVIAGHIHNYQRFQQNGITYLVSGGGGAKPHPVARSAGDLYQDASFPNFHYVRFDYDGETLNASMFRLADPAASTPVWERKDTFTITPVTK